MKSILQHHFLTLIIVSLAFLSCDCSINKNEISLDKFEDNPIHHNINTLENTDKVTPDFRVALIDSIDSKIQRVFVVIDSINIEVIQNAICEVSQNYRLTERSNISFFTDEKYANYKDEVFFMINDDPFKDENNYLPIEEYENWRNEYYLAEYDLKSKELVLFPANVNKKPALNPRSNIQYFPK